jgi:hypothetical protein
MPAIKRSPRHRAPRSGFISYSHKDMRRCDELKEHLSQLVRERILSVWHDGLIDQRKPWDKDIARNLKAAHIVLFLVSSRFLHSHYCCEIEVKEALLRAKKGKTIVLPVLIGSCDYEKSTFARYNVFHLNGRPIGGNRDRRDDGWTKVAKKVRALLA